jgi:hypothetical protein
LADQERVDAGDRSRSGILSNSDPGPDFAKLGYENVGVRDLLSDFGISTTFTTRQFSQMSEMGKLSKSLNEVGCRNEGGISIRTLVSVWAVMWERYRSRWSAMSSDGDMDVETIASNVIDSSPDKVLS